MVFFKNYISKNTTPITCLIVILGLGCHFSETEAQLFSKTYKVNGHVVNIDSLNEQVERILGEVGASGLSLAVIDHNEVVFYNTYGHRRLERKKEGVIIAKGRVNKKTVFEAASLSKSFTVFATHKLVDKGILDWDTPLYKYLPYPILEHDERYKQITARMILSHTSGIENLRAMNNPKTLEIIREPGKHYIYSGEGYLYLSSAIEKVLNQSVVTYLENLVYEPLGLKRTFTVYTKHGKKPRNYSVGHNSFKQQYTKYKNETPEIIAFISTTARDYAKVLIGLANPDEISRQRFNDIMTPVIKSGKQDDKFSGLGFEIFYTPEDTLLIQSGSSTGFKGLACYSINRKFGMVMLVNNDRGQHIENILCELTTRLNLRSYFEDIYYNPYPNVASELFNTYNEQGFEKFKLDLERLLSSGNDKVTQRDLFDLGFHFMEKEPAISAYVVEEFGKRYPNSNDAFLLLGVLNMKDKRFGEAIEYFERALTLSDGSNIVAETFLNMCKSMQ